MSFERDWVSLCQLPATWLSGDVAESKLKSAQSIRAFSRGYMYG